MRFTADAHPGVEDGTTTVTFRRWRRPQVRAGGRYNVGAVMVEVDTVSQVTVGAITEVDAKAAGFADRASMLRFLDRLGEPLNPGDEVWRIDFHLLGAAQRSHPLAETDSVDDSLLARLDRLDRASPNGPWTAQVLRLIADRPEVVSTDLAAALGRDRPSFKLDVRKLKALGLTRSFNPGYRLTPRGEAVLRALETR